METKVQDVEVTITARVQDSNTAPFVIEHVLVNGQTIPLTQELALMKILRVAIVDGVDECAWE